MTRINQFGWLSTPHHMVWGQSCHMSLMTASRSLSASEQNYSMIEKEALAIVFGIKKFHQYLFGRCFSLLTDHRPLTLLLGPKHGIPVLAAFRLQCWAIQLSAYQYDIEYQASKDHANADKLSRLPRNTVEEPEYRS